MQPKEVAQGLRSTRTIARHADASDGAPCAASNWLLLKALLLKMHLIRQRGYGPL
jgi:hypothetical protein